MALSIKLDGSAEHGWMGEVHDGDTLTTHSPEGPTITHALRDMLNRHFGHDGPTAAEQEKMQADVAAAQVRMKAAQAEAAAKLVPPPAPVVTKPTDAPKP